jgi:hypothetical protein
MRWDWIGLDGRRLWIAWKRWLNDERAVSPTEGRSSRRIQPPVNSAALAPPESSFGVEVDVFWRTLAVALAMADRHEREVYASGACLRLVPAGCLVLYP